MATKKKALQAAAGNAGGEALVIEDVFSTYLYTGNGSTQTITNGIDFAGKGGLVWIKERPNAESHQLFDTERGNTKILSSDSTAAEGTVTTRVTAFNSDGFSLGSNASVNQLATTYASWTFRKAPRFFDVVTTSIPSPEPSTFTINHNLGTTVGMVIVKTTTSTYDWIVFHRSLPSNYQLDLNNSTAQAFYGGTNWSSTDTTVTLPGWAGQSGGDVVIYLFAHDPLGPSGDGSDGLIACGSTTTNGSGFFDVDLGWEPQFVMFKTTSTSGDWWIFDTMRGMSLSNQQGLRANLSSQEVSYNNTGYIYPTASGFASSGNFIGTNRPVVYIAIRRGPMRAPTSGTEMFAVDLSGSTAPRFESSFPVDMAFWRPTPSSNTKIASRLTGTKSLLTNDTSSEDSANANVWDFMDGFYDGGITSNYAWMFRRAPGFFDVVAFSGDGTNGRTVPHNLGVTPEMVIIKRRTNNGSGDSDAEHWAVWHPALNSNSIVYLSKNGGQVGYAADSYYPRYATLTGNSPESQIDLGVLSYGVHWTNSATETYVAYLFATLAGVSKVGSYTGNGSSQTINCGFTSGARFVLIKRTNSTGDWYVWDTARGIVAGNDPHLSLNTTAAQVTTNDSIDPDSSGFIVNQVSATNVNVSSSSYIFLAIA
jgi:hypothetical protein